MTEQTKAQVLDKLNDALLAAEEHLESLALGTPGTIELYAGAVLAWTRYRGEYQLRVSWTKNERAFVEHVISAPAELRIAAARALPQLLVRLKHAYPVLTQGVELMPYPHNVTFKRKKVACVACGRVLVASMNGHPRKHSPKSMQSGSALARSHRGQRRHLGTCAGTFLPGDPP